MPAARLGPHQIPRRPRRRVRWRQPGVHAGVLSGLRRQRRPGGSSRGLPLWKPAEAGCTPGSTTGAMVGGGQSASADFQDGSPRLEPPGVRAACPLTDNSCVHPPGARPAHRLNHPRLSWRRKGRPDRRGRRRLHPRRHQRPGALRQRHEHWRPRRQRRLRQALDLAAGRGVQDEDDGGQLRHQLVAPGGQVGRGAPVPVIKTL